MSRMQFLEPSENLMWKLRFAENENTVEYNP